MVPRSTTSMNTTKHKMFTIHNLGTAKMIPGTKTLFFSQFTISRPIKMPFYEYSTCFFHHDKTTPFNPFRTAVLFWGQTTQTSSSLTPERDCGPKRVNVQHRQNETKKTQQNRTKQNKTNTCSTYLVRGYSYTTK